MFCIFPPQKAAFWILVSIISTQVFLLTCVNLNTTNILLLYTYMNLFVYISIFVYIYMLLWLHKYNFTCGILYMFLLNIINKSFCNYFHFLQWLCFTIKFFFLCAYCLFIHLLWRSICSNVLSLICLFSCCWGIRLLYVICIKFLVRYIICKYFLLVRGMAFHFFFTVSSKDQRFLILIKTFLTFSCMACALLFKKSLSKPLLQRFSPRLSSRYLTVAALTFQSIIKLIFCMV